MPANNSQCFGNRLCQCLEIRPRFRSFDVLLVGNQVPPTLACVGIVSDDSAHQRLGSLAFSLNLGVVSALFALAFDDPVHPVGVLGYEVWEVAVSRVEVDECVVLWMQAVPPFDLWRGVEQFR